MCGCSTHASSSNPTAAPDQDALTLRVEDMTCGHCASTITKAIEKGLPGATVEADPALKTVLVRGTADLAAVRSLVTEAGYTPSAA